MILHCFDFNHRAPLLTPTDPNVHLHKVIDPNNEPDVTFPYVEAIGFLQFAQMGTDLIFHLLSVLWPNSLATLSTLIVLMFVSFFNILQRALIIIFPTRAMMMLYPYMPTVMLITMATPLISNSASELSSFSTQILLFGATTSKLALLGPQPRLNILLARMSPKMLFGFVVSLLILVLPYSDSRIFSPIIKAPLSLSTIQNFTIVRNT